MKLQNYNLKHWNNHAITKSVEFEDKRVLLLEIENTKFPERDGHRNLIATDKDENILWIAELPINEHLYSYYNDLYIEDGLIMALSGSFQCKINASDGQIIDERFVK